MNWPEILGALQDRFKFQPSELWEMEGYDLIFWTERAAEIDERHKRHGR